MTNKTIKTGRTLYDHFAEHPKIAIMIYIVLTITICAIVFGFLFGNLSLKIWGIEINKAQCISDTIYIHKTDTIKIEKTIFKERALAKENKRIELKKGDTLITTTNQPANINIGGTQNVVQENKGIVGNNNNINLNFDNGKHLDEENQLRLIQLLDNTIKSNNKTRDIHIAVGSLIGNSNAHILATEIVKFLKLKKYNIDNYIGEFMNSPPINGVQIGMDRLDKEKIVIMVGYL